MGRKVILEMPYRKAIKEYYEYHDEKSEVIRKCQWRSVIAVLCHVADKKGNEHATLVGFDYDSHGEMYATEINSCEIEDENRMADDFERDNQYEEYLCDE